MDTYTQDFYFRVVDYGIDNCNSLLRARRRYSKGTQGTSSDTSMPSSPESTRAVHKSENPNRTGGLIESKEVEESDSLPFKKIPENNRLAREDGKEVKVEDGKEVKVIDTDKDMQDVTDMMATVKLVPRQVRFGRRGGGMVGFSSRR